MRCNSLATPENFAQQTVRISGSVDYQIYVNFLSNLASNKFLSFLEPEFYYRCKPENPSLNGFIIDP
jgi:hypothetical protein